MVVPAWLSVGDHSIDLGVPPGTGRGVGRLWGKSGRDSSLKPLSGVRYTPDHILPKNRPDGDSRPFLHRTTLGTWSHRGKPGGGLTESIEPSSRLGVSFNSLLKGTNFCRFSMGTEGNGKPTGAQER